MGVPFFTTYVDGYLNIYVPIELTGKNIIIDGTSLCYEMCRQINGGKNTAHRSIDYNEYKREYFRPLFHLLKEKCKSIVVVFDGIVTKKRDYLRKIDYQIRTENNKPPILLINVIKSVLNELNIRYQVAIGEGDETCVVLANKEDAFILASDSDYYFHNLKKGYIPFKHLDTGSLKGKVYHAFKLSKNIHNLALLAVLQGYNFLDHETIQCHIKCPGNLEKENKFNQWLEQNCFDETACSHLKFIFCVLQWLEFTGNIQIDTSRFYQLISKKRIRAEFQATMQIYLNPTTGHDGLLTKCDNRISKKAVKLVSSGKLDPIVIDILVNRRFFISNQNHIEVLLPIFGILVEWDLKKANTVDRDYNVISKNLTLKYNLFDKLKEYSSNIPKLKDAERMKNLKSHVFRCLTYTIKFQDKSKKRKLYNQHHHIHKDYRLWLLMIYHWYKTTTISYPFVYLCAFIISFLKLNFLDTYDYNHNSILDNDNLSSSFLRHSVQLLKTSLSHSECRHIRQKIPSDNHVPKDSEIIIEVQNVEQLYQNTIILNEFFKQPYTVLPPQAVFSIDLIYAFVEKFKNENKIQTTKKKIFKMFSQKEVLCRLFDEIYSFIAN
ncbi:unnamed protein product [Didymodactylos carnosus]|uniref:Asteroid domain-containing protein n=1 Tax=Didymodactylos carnosus TaxID=1234261 RepID=A0A814YE77_9BILA|nr:unnamed protein product [Didymodactylos carnosus]CAF3991890.1 unnamed protein product [Didymodactylos carnosus]